MNATLPDSGDIVGASTGGLGLLCVLCAVGLAGYSCEEFVADSVAATRTFLGGRRPSPAAVASQGPEPEPAERIAPESPKPLVWQNDLPRRCSVRAQTVQIRAEPSPKAKPVRKAKAGESFLCDLPVNGWYPLRTSTSLLGFLATSTVTIAPAPDPAAEAQNVARELTQQMLRPTLNTVTTLRKMAEGSGGQGPAFDALPLAFLRGYFAALNASPDTAGPAARGLGACPGGTPGDDLLWPLAQRGFGEPVILAAQAVEGTWLAVTAGGGVIGGKLNVQAAPGDDCVLTMHQHFSIPDAADDATIQSALRKAASIKRIYAVRRDQQTGSVVLYP